jgi:hypothetical protein
MTGFLVEIGVESCIFDEGSKKRAKKGDVGRPFSLKVGPMRSA